MATSFTSVWPRNGNNVLLEPEQPSLADGVGLGRAEAPSHGPNPAFAVNGAGYRFGSVVVAVGHCVGSLSPGLPTNTGTPLASTHGALNVGSTTPNLKGLVENVCGSLTPNLCLL